MLAIQARCHKGHIQLDQLDEQGIPEDADVVVLFLPKNITGANNSVAALGTATASLNVEQRTAWQMQSLSSFAQTDLLNPQEDVWNNA